MVSSESVDFALDNYLSKCLAYAKWLVITACTGIDVKKTSNSLLYMHGAWRNAGAQIQPGSHAEEERCGRSQVGLRLVLLSPCTVSSRGKVQLVMYLWLHWQVFARERGYSSK